MPDRTQTGVTRIALYGTAIFGSAFLIFMVQPMVGKRILPWFGGAPAVWTVCLAFYQTSLLFGYAYAHALSRLRSPTTQLAIHAIAVIAAFAALPVLPAADPNFDGATNPTRLVLALLTRDVALPFMVLAATGPLVQHWHALAHPEKSPYILYAVSNLGSFAALFAYPFAIEPRLGLSATGRLWDTSFAAVGALVLACAVHSAQSRRASEATSSAEADSFGPELSRPPTLSELVRWILLSATAVTVLMGVTNKLCLDVASVPFLWLLPLATYLATFILAFSSDRVFHRGLFATLSIASFGATRVMPIESSILVQAAAYCVLLFGCGMLLHGEIYRSRPSPRFLTRFYLATSTGGAIGGLLVGIGAPILLDDYTELPLSLLATIILVLATCAIDPTSTLYMGRHRWRWAAAGPITLGIAGYFLWEDLRPERFAVHQERSFFGVLTVTENRPPTFRSLANGSTRHGSQLLGDVARRRPTSYFGIATGAGFVFTSRPIGSNSRIGVIGLGAGTLAAYGRAGDSMRFYEIDPVVAKIAGRDGYFTYIEDSSADVEIVLGDARRSIEDEQRRASEQNFDMMVLDAFSSDAVPVHLMTKEAFEFYFRAIAPDGLLLVHVSNRHFDLRSIVCRIAQELGATSMLMISETIPRLQSEGSDWIVISRDAERLARLRIRIENRVRSMQLPRGSLRIIRGSDLLMADVPLWTDDYSDLWRVMRWRRTKPRGEILPPS